MLPDGEDEEGVMLALRLATVFGKGPVDRAGLKVAKACIHGAIDGVQLKSAAAAAQGMIDEGAGAGFAVGRASGGLGNLEVLASSRRNGPVNTNHVDSVRYRRAIHSSARD
jgi:hypothetical protein